MLRKIRKETIKALIEKMIAMIIIMLMLTTNIQSFAVPLVAKNRTTSTENKAQNSEDKVTLESQFLEFYQIGETKKIAAKYAGNETLEYKSADEKTATVDKNGNITWVSGKGPVLISVYAKGKPDTKVDCFASFEGEIENNENQKQNEEPESTPNQEIDEENKDKEVQENEEINEIKEEAKEKSTKELVELEKETLSNIPSPFISYSITPFSGFTTTPMIMQGVDFTVVLKQDGTVWTWGNNNQGQLGDGTTTQRNIPMQVKGENGAGYLNNILQISCGERHVIALDKNGKAYVWGYNNLGQLGDGTLARSLYPIKVAGLLEEKTIKYVTAGAMGSCAVDTDGKVYLWGNNSYGQLGMNHVTTPVNTPTIANALGQENGEMTGVDKIAMAYEHTVFLKNDGTVWTVGRNYYGELGNNSATSSTAKSTIAVQVVDNTGGNPLGSVNKIKDITAGYYVSGAVGENGKAYIWGRGTNGTTGQGAVADAKIPVIVKAPNGVDELLNIKKLNIWGQSSYSFAMALSNDGKVYTWGYNNVGQLGTGNSTQSLLPIEPVKADDTKFTNAIDINTPNIYSGSGSSAVVTDDGKIYMSGYNAQGQLATFDKTNRNKFTYVDTEKLAVEQQTVKIKKNETAPMNVTWDYGMNLLVKSQPTLAKTYTSLDTNIATVNTSGVVTGKNIGSTTIKVTETNSGKTVYVPVEVRSNDTNSGTYAMISQSQYFTLALKEDGTVWSWGYNANGQLGNNTTINSGKPTQVVGVNGQGFLSNIIKISAGINHAIAVDKDGNTYTWGYNDYGKLGDGSTGQKNYPVKVLSVSGDTQTYLTDIIDVSAQYYTSVAVDKNGYVYTWGYNGHGQLGVNSTGSGNYTRPVKVLDPSATCYLKDIIQIEAGYYHTTALSRDGQVYTWGYNGYGQIGNNTTTNTALPVKVNITDITKIAVGDYHNLAVKEDGTVYAWGIGTNGQLGDNASSNRLLPVNVKTPDGASNITNISDISAGGYHSFVIDKNNKGYGFGLNSNGDLGIGNTTTTINKPTEIKVDQTKRTVAMIPSNIGGISAMLLKEDGSIYATGNNNYGQIGFSNQANSNEFMPVFDEVLSNKDNEISIKKGETYQTQIVLQRGLRLINSQANTNLTYQSKDTSIMSVNSAGVVTGVNIGKTYLKVTDSISGKITYLQVSVRSNNEKAVAYPQVEMGYQFTVALKEDGTVWAWGLGTSGQLGNNATVNTPAPVQVKGVNAQGYLQNIVKISVGYSHTLALDKDGNVYAWGDNTYGRLGDASATQRTYPVKVMSVSGDSKTYLEDIVDISAGYYHSIAVDKNGQVYGWGHNNNGQLGTGTTNSNNAISRPVRTIGADGSTYTLLDNITQVEAGYNITLARDKNGQVYSWGYNGHGNLGINNTTAKYFPQKVVGKDAVGYLEKIMDISVGEYFTLALHEDETVYGWGYNGQGQLGQANTTNMTTPVQVKGEEGVGVISNIKQIYSGMRHSLILDKNGITYGFGNNSYGEQGLGNNTVNQVPSKMLDETNLRTIAISGTSSSGYSSAIMKENGKIYTTGQNSTYVLGLGDTVNRNQIEEVIAKSLIEENRIVRIKENESYQLKINWVDGFNLIQNSANKSLNLSYESSNEEIAIVNNTGKVTAKKRGEAYIQITDSISGITIYTPVYVQSNAAGVVTNPQVVNGENFSAVLKEDGTVWTWGYNSNGRLGNGNTTNQASPVRVLAGEQKENEEQIYLKDIIKICANTQNVLALDKNGNVYGWGYNGNGGLGTNNTTNYPEPVKVLGGEQDNSYLENIIDIGSKSQTSIALDKNGNVYTWGYNGQGQLGVNDTTQRTTPVRVFKDTSDAVKVFVGENNTFILTSKGEVFGAGIDTYGELGLGATSGSRPTYVQMNDVGAVGKIKDIVDIASSTNHTILLKYDGTVFASGRNAYGEIGDNGSRGTSTSASYRRYNPVQVKGTVATENLENISSIAVGEYTSYAVSKDGIAYAWGYNNYGQMGNGNTTNPPIPVIMQKEAGLGNFNDAIQIADGNKTNHTIVIDKQGNIWTAGYNGYYQLGIGTTNNMTYMTKMMSPFLDLNLGTNVTLKVNEEKDIITNINPGFGVYLNPIQMGSLTYTSLDTNIATVTNTGKLKAIKKGIATILVKDNTNNLTAILKVNVLTNETNSISQAYIVGGKNHTVALKEDGSVWTWGDNTYGQLGDGTNIPARIPVRVKNVSGEGYLENIVKVTAGFGFTVAIDKDGNLYTWGQNNYGQLGINNTINSNLPKKVDITDVVDISANANGYFVLALKKDQTIWSSGYNNYGQLGDNTATQSNKPVKVIGNYGNIVRISAGESFSLALTSDGKIYSWGYNGYGQLGNNTTTTRYYPQYVQNSVNDGPLEDIIEIEAGAQSSYAITKDGTAYSFGQNTYGKLSDNSQTTRPLPVLMQKQKEGGTENLTNIKEIKAGTNHTIIRLADGKIHTVGYNNYGQLGNGSQTQEILPVEIKEGLTNEKVIGIGAGDEFSYALLENGELNAWGRNIENQLANTNASSDFETLPILSGSNLKAQKGQFILKKGDNVTLNISYDVYMNLLNGKQTPSIEATVESTNETIATIDTNKKVEAKEYGTTFIQIKDEKTGIFTSVNIIVSEYVNDNNLKIADIQTGTDFTLMLKEDGTLWSMGTNNYGQLGNGTVINSHTPTRVVGENGQGYLENIVQITVGLQTAYALRVDGTVWAWGYNGYGQLGINNTANQSYPVQVKGMNGTDFLNKIKYIASGNNHVLAVEDNGNLWAWGLNNYGMLGDNTTTQRNTPILSKTTNVKQVSAGGNGTIAVLSDGTVVGFGRQTYGQLGNGNTSNVAILTKVQVKKDANTILDNIDSVSMGEYHTIALSKDGTVWSWGYNGHGQIGINNTTNQSYAKQVLGVNNKTGKLENIYKIAVQQSVSIALDKEGNAYAWGYNGNGNIGDATTTNRPYPVSIKYADTLEDIKNVSIISDGHSNHTVLALKDGSLWGTGEKTGYKLGDEKVSYPSIGYEAIFGKKLVSKESRIRLQKDSTKQLEIEYQDTCNIYAKENIIGTLTYKSLDESITTVNNSGVVTGINSGNTTIKVTDTNNNIHIYIPVEITKTGKLATAQVSNGQYNTLILKADGTVWATGLNTNGQLGIGDLLTTDQLVQVLAPEGEGYLENIVQIVAGATHSVALDKNGNVYAWGNNSYGKIGNGAASGNITRPYKIESLKDIVKISAGDHFTIALDKNGKAYGWGRNNTYQLGDSTTADRPTPIEVTGMKNVIDISTQYEATHILTNDGKVYGFGRNEYGQLSDKTTSTRITAYPAYDAEGKMLNSIISIQSGYNYSILEKEDHNYLATGYNQYGQFAKNSSGDTIYAAIPILTDVEDKKDVFASIHNIFVTKTDGTIWGSGYNNYGQIGDNSATQRNVLSKLVDETGRNDLKDIIYVQKSTSSQHHTFIKEDGTVWAVGRNNYGQLGNEGNQNSSVVVQMFPSKLESSSFYIRMNKEETKQLEIKLKQDLNVFIEEQEDLSVSIEDSTIASIDNQYNITAKKAGITQIIVKDNKTNETYNIRLEVTDDNKKANAMVESYGNTTVALKEDGTVWAWGDNSFGQLGQGNFESTALPLKVKDPAGENYLEDIINIAVGENHILAVSKIGKVYTWGYNGYGQLGTGNTTNRSLPVEINIQNVTKVIAGKDHSVALTADGTVWTWGYNGYGQLGDNSATNRNVPVGVLNEYATNKYLDKIVDIAAGQNHTLALTADGTVYAWGINTEGQCRR